MPEKIRMEPRERKEERAKSQKLEKTEDRLEEQNSTDSKKHLVTIMTVGMTDLRLSQIRPKTEERENSKRMTRTVTRRMQRKEKDILLINADSEGEEEEEDLKGLETDRKLTIEIQ